MYASLKDAVGERAVLHDKAEILVLMMMPGMVKGWWDGQKPSVFTMWETDTLPVLMHDHLSQFDKVLVPCEHNRAAFSKWHPNVVTVPLGVDLGRWRPSDRPPNDKFRILTGGSNWVRKGIDAVIRAFLEVNPPNAELVIKTIPDLIGEVPPISDPRISVCQEYLTPDQEVDLYRSADLYVSASRGEGWGLMPLQAIAAGIPTLVSATSGHMEFINLATRVIKTTPQPVNVPPLYTVGLWDEPDHQSVVDGITWFLDNRDTARDKALKNAVKASRFSWDNAAKRLLSAVGTGPVVEGDKWKRADPGLVPLRVRRRTKATIGVHRVDLAPNETHMVPVNVRDVIVEAGLAVEDR